MSTRSLVGGLTDSGVRVVYVHNDGYPSGRLPVLDAIIQRDGAEKALATIVSAIDGGWSFLDAAVDTSSRGGHLGDRGRVVEGYGLAYADAPAMGTQRWPEEYSDESWTDYVYLIEDGSIRWAAVERGTAPDAWDWQKHEVGQEISDGV